MRLSTQLPPQSSTTADTDSTKPGRSLPMTVTTSDSMADSLHSLNHARFKGFHVPFQSTEQKRLDLAELPL